MKGSASTYYNQKTNNNSKDKLKGTGLHAINADIDSKPVLNMMASSTRNHFSSLSELNSGDYFKQPTSSSAFNSPKMSTSYASQFNSSSILNKHGAQATKNSENKFLIPEKQKDSSITSKAQPDTTKRPSLSKFNTGTSSNRTLSQKIDFYVSAQKTNQPTKAESKGTLKEDKTSMGSPKNLCQRKERFFGSYEPTPTNSASKNGFMRSEACGSGKKPQGFEIRDLAPSTMTAVSPLRKNCQETPYSGEENTKNPSTNSYANQQAGGNTTEGQTGRVKSANSSSFLSAKPEVLFNNLISPSNKINERPFNKGHQKSFHEHDFLKLGNVNDPARLKNKGSTSIYGSKSSKNFSSSSVYLNENYPQCDTNLVTPITPLSTADQQNVSAKDQAENQGILTLSSLYKERRYNYQEYLRGKRGEYEKSNTNQSTAVQTLKSSTSNLNSLENSERALNNKTNNLSKSKLSNSRDQLGEVGNDKNRFASGGIINGETTLSSQLKQNASKYLVQNQNEQEDLTNINSSQGPAKNVAKSRSFIQNIQDIIEIEKKKNEALKNRFSMNLDTNRLTKEKSELTSALSLIKAASNKSLESERLHEKNYPISAKNSVASLHLDSGVASLHQRRDSSIDNFASLIKYSASQANSPVHGQNEFGLKPGNSNRYKYLGYQSMDLEPECLTKEFQPETKKTQDEIIEPSQVNLIEFEEISMNDNERRLNSRGTKFTYELESDRTDHQVTERRYPSKINPKSNELKTDTTTDINLTREKPKQFPDKSEAAAEQLQKIAARMKKVITDSQHRECVWKNEKSQMQKRINELERRLSKYEEI